MRAYTIILGGLGLMLLGFLFGFAMRSEDPPEITADHVAAAEQLFGLQFTPAERDSMLRGLARNRTGYAWLREQALDNSIPPSLVFQPLPVGFKLPDDESFVLTKAATPTVPDDLEKLAYASVRELAQLLRTRKVTSTELTKMYLARLKRYAPKLECLVTLTEDLALRQAAKADAEIAAGTYRGPLHGIPYGAKDLLAVPGYPTTWGAMPYREQMRDETATVIAKLEEAGAVLVAKLTLGALAMGDVWYGGKTRNPWDLEQGSSGSSAGSAAATAAGLVGFAIGTETWGSIVSPSTRCGVTGLRPTYGRVSRHGAMALSWSMDKIGPICRSVEDAALVLRAIQGPDGQDQSVIDVPFAYDATQPLSKLRIGYTKSLFEKEYDNSERDAAVLEVLRTAGATLQEIELPEISRRALAFGLTVEAAAAFEELTLSGRDDMLVRQISGAWPNAFRMSRFAPAVEFVQASRFRYALIQKMARLFDNIDVYVVPSFGGENLLMTNLTGHPCVVVPNGFNEKGRPTSISFIGDLFNEGAALRVAQAFQSETDFHLRKPPQFK